MSTSSPGTFRLGAMVDPESHDRQDEQLLYESGDLTTHGVIVGVTGSGKTGLAIDLLEEALADGIPTLILDPKQLWTEGLAGWGLGPPDITALRDGAHFTIYTPGSDAGVPLDLIGSLASPTAEGGPARGRRRGST